MTFFTYSDEGSVQMFKDKAVMASVAAWLPEAVPFSSYQITLMMFPFLNFASQ